MGLRVQARTWMMAVAMCMLVLAPAWAQQWVSVRNDNVNMRSGPGTNSTILFKLAQGYPLQVLERRGNWLRVQDFEGDRGWIGRSVTGNTPHHIVKSTRINLRSGPGTQHPIVGSAQYGDILRTTRRQGDWVQVQNPNGRGTAWVASSLVWGW